MTTIPQRDLRNHNAQIIDRVVAGESFIVTRDGRPVADVRPYEDDARPPAMRATSDLAAFLAPTALDAHRWAEDIRAGDDIVRDEPWEE